MKAIFPTHRPDTINHHFSAMFRLPRSSLLEHAVHGQRFSPGAREMGITRVQKRGSVCVCVCVCGPRDAATKYERAIITIGRKVPLGRSRLLRECEHARARVHTWPKLFLHLSPSPFLWLPPIGRHRYKPSFEQPSTDLFPLSFSFYTLPPFSSSPAERNFLSRPEFRATAVQPRRLHFRHARFVNPRRNSMISLGLFSLAPGGRGHCHHHHHHHRHTAEGIDSLPSGSRNTEPRNEEPRSTKSLHLPSGCFYCVRAIRSSFFSNRLTLSRSATDIKPPRSFLSLLSPGDNRVQ